MKDKTTRIKASYYDDHYARYHAYPRRTDWGVVVRLALAGLLVFAVIVAMLWLSLIVFGGRTA